MRIPYPERFNTKPVFLFVVALFLLQQLEGTDIFFSLLTSAYILLFAAAFNAAGGMFFPSGAFIFFTGTLVAIVGLTYKAVFVWEAGQTHLQSPITTMLVYCAGMAVMWLAAGISRRILAKKQGMLADISANETMLQSAIACFFIGFFLGLVFGSEYSSTGTFGSAVRQFNRFPQMAILLATTYQINKSKGNSATNWVVLLSVGAMFAGGVIYSSKEGMIVGPVTWLIAAAAGGYNFKRYSILVGGFAIWFLVYYMVPYSQYVRGFRDKNGDRAANTATAGQYIFRLGEVRRLYLESTPDETYTEAPHFYNDPQGFIDRLSMIAYDDAIIDRTEQGYIFGLSPTYEAIINVIPRILWKDKPFFFTANDYGREIGVIGEDDITTGISFSPVADAYHEAKWFGVAVVLGLSVFAYFFIMDSLTGSVRYSPWGLLPIALSAHLAPEGLIGGLILQSTYGTVGIVLVAWTVRYVFPLALRFFTGGERTIVRKGREFSLGAGPLRLVQLSSAADPGNTTP